MDYRPVPTASGLERYRTRNVPTVAANDRFASPMSTVVDGRLEQALRDAAMHSQRPEEGVASAV